MRSLVASESMCSTARRTCGHSVRAVRVVEGVLPELGDRERELAVAVVLGHRVGAALRRAARHLAVRELERRVPEQEVSRDVVLAEAQQRRRRQRAVADPRAGVRARSRLQRRAAAVDEDVAERGAQRRARCLRPRPDRRCARGRGDRANARGARLGGREVGRRRSLGRAADGQRHGDVALLARSKPQVERQHGAGEAGRVDDVRRCRDAGASAASRRPVRSRAARAARRSGDDEREQPRHTVDGEHVAVPAQIRRSRSRRPGWRETGSADSPGTAATRARA